MRKSLVVLFILTAVVCGLFANHFTPAWWGQNPYLAMNFYIYGADVAGTPLSAGDEIGIFDGNTLVGAIQLTGPISSYPYQQLPIKVSMLGGSLPGSAVPGHFIKFKAYRAATSTEYSYPEMSVWFDKENFTTFEIQGTSYINLISWSAPTGTSTQTLTPPAGSGGGYVYNTSFPAAGILLNQIWVNASGGGPITAWSFNTPTLDFSFNGTPPAYNPNYGWFVDGSQVSYYATVSYPIIISFSLLGLQNIGDPEDIVLYHRAIHGTGPFTPVTAVYNYMTGYLTAQVTSFGEFIIGSSSIVNQTGSLDGHVYAYGTTTPLANTLVTIGTYTDVTDANGYYSFDTLPTGFYTAYYEADGYVRTGRNITVLTGSSSTIDVYMVPDDMPPLVPQYLSIERVPDGFRLEWQISEIAQSYKIYVSENPYGPYSFLAVTDMTFIVLTDGFLLANGVNPQFSFFRLLAETELP